MYTAVYALSRLILFGFGWGIAALLALLAELMVSGTKWPLFTLFAAWWTFACAIYVQGESTTPARPNKPLA